MEPCRSQLLRALIEKGLAVEGSTQYTAMRGKMEIPAPWSVSYLMDKYLLLA